MLATVTLCYARRFARRTILIFLRVLAVLALFAAECFAQQSQPVSASPAKSAGASSQAGPELPYTPTLDPTAMDHAADPCVDFYQYSCGGWQKKNPIPPDQTSWSVYGKLYEDNLQYLRGLLEQAASAKDRDPNTQKIGDFYASCMNETLVEKLGAEPMQPNLAAVQNLKDRKQLAPLIADLQLQGVSVLFNFGPSQDPDDSDRMIVDIGQGGLGLPDRDYYIKDDAKSKETRERYLQHMQKMFELMGDSPEAAKMNAATVMRMETSLAKASLTRVERRDPYKQKHKMTVPDLYKVAPDFDWNGFFVSSAVPKFEILNVSWPDFFKDVNSQIKSASLADWQTYIRWHVAHSRAPFLSSAFVNENFEFYRKYLRGAKELQPRWKRCVQYVDGDLGEALGQVYVQKTFGPELKASTVEMTRQIEDAMAVRIQQLAWMSPATKQQALGKLKAVRNKVGFPDKWRDYSSVTIVPADFYGNDVRATEFEEKRQFAKVGQPVDRTEWDMTPPTVDAYYNPQMNDINFPAGVLQPPLYDAKMDAAPNYGNTGSTIGHELTHANCVVDQYGQYVIVDDIKINSKLTEGEDVADLGGTILAYVAWKNATKGSKLESADGLTPDQRFFVGFAQWACENQRPENLRVSAMTNPHSPGVYRINGVVVNMPEFGQAFACKAGQPMVKPNDKVCRVW